MQRRAVGLRNKRQEGEAHMGNRRNRTRELADAAEKIEKEIFAEKIRILESKYRKEEYRGKVKSAFKEVFLGWENRNGRSTEDKTERKRESGSKAGCMGICYLYSSILMRTYEFRIVIYNEDFYLDNCPLIYPWRPPCFFETFEEDMEIVMGKLRKIYPRICRLEEDAVRFRCVEYYLASVSALCADMLDEICCMDGFEKLTRAEDFFVFYGRYRGEGEILCRFAGGKEEGDSGSKMIENAGRTEGKKGEDKERKETPAKRKEYLMLDAQKGNSLPDIVNWYGKLDVRYLNRADYRKLPKYIILDMKTGEDTVYPDIITKPALMVSAEAMEVIWRYQPGFPSVFIVLFDTAREESVSYCCPILEEGEEAQKKGEVLYKVHTDKESGLRIRLELAETLLGYGAAGMELAF